MSIIEKYQEIVEKLKKNLEETILFEKKVKLFRNDAEKYKDGLEIKKIHKEIEQIK